MMTSTFLPAISEEEEKIMRHDGAVIWPFTSGFMIYAMSLSTNPAHRVVAKKEFEKWNSLKGFYEWYDVREGRGYGSVDQAWSAAMFLRVAKKLAH